MDSWVFFLEIEGNLLGPGGDSELLNGDVARRMNEDITLLLVGVLPLSDDVEAKMFIFDSDGRRLSFFGRGCAELVDRFDWVMEGSTNTMPPLEPSVSPSPAYRSNAS